MRYLIILILFTINCTKTDSYSKGGVPLCTHRLKKCQKLQKIIQQAWSNFKFKNLTDKDWCKGTWRTIWKHTKKLIDYYRILEGPFYKLEKTFCKDKLKQAKAKVKGTPTSFLFEKNQWCNPSSKLPTLGEKGDAYEKDGNLLLKFIKGEKK